MPFFKSFWRETGKNTGKWASNKVFGDGWSTPLRVHRSYSNNEKNSSNSVTDYRSSEISREREVERNSEKSSLLEQVNSIKFTSDNPRVISVQMDELFTLLRYAKEKNYSVNNMIDSRIRSGILLLSRLGDVELAQFYKKELNQIRYWGGLSEGLKIILIFVGLLVSPIALLWIYKYLFKAIAWILN